MKFAKVAFLCERLAHRTYCNSTFAQDMISGPHLEYGLLLTECQELCLDNTLPLFRSRKTQLGIFMGPPGEAAFFQQSP